MKKISSILIAVILFVSMLVPAMATTEFTQENITIEQNVFDIKITVETNTDGRMIVRLSDESKTILYGLDFSGTPAENDGVYTYTFTFGLESSVPTSTLCVSVGNSVPATEKTFDYTNLNDKNDFYNNLELIQEPEQVDGYFASNSSAVSVDLTEYNEDITPKTRKMVNKIIVDLELATGYENLETETPEYSAQKAAAIAVVESRFKTAFAQAMKYAKITDAKENEWEVVVSNSIEENLFDAKFYTAEGTESPVLQASEVYNAFVTEKDAMTELTATEVKNTFDRATLVAIKQKCAYGILKTAFLYFEDKGTVAVSDMTDIDALVSSGNDVDLWKDLKGAECADCAELVSKAIEIAKTLTTGTPSGGGNAPAGGSNSSVSSPGGFTGGGLGGGGGATTPTVPVPPVVSDGVFTDIASVEWAKESIEALAQKGVINGKGDGKFAPNDSVTREEFVKIIIGAFDLLNENAGADFGDVDASRWSYAFIATANELGIVTGDGASFNPTGAMSRQDMAVVIFRTAEKLGLELSGEAQAFDDNDDIADYAKNAVASLTASGIINGMGDGIFAPKSTVTRAQAAKVIYGLMKLVGGGK